MKGYVPQTFHYGSEIYFQTTSANWIDKAINIDDEYLHHLRFADDIVITTDNLGDAQEMLEDLK